MSTTPPITISYEPFDIGSDFDFYHHHTQQQQQQQQQQHNHPKRIDISSDDILNMFTTFSDDPDLDQAQQPLPPPEDAYIASSITSSPSSQSSTRSSSTSSSSSSINKTYKFGKELSSDHLPYSNSNIPTFNPADFADTSNLKYQIKITEDFPSKSRVETQIKIAMNFYPPPKENMIHLPADTISKPKLQLKEPFKPIKSCLMLDTFVVCDSNLHKFVNICQGCMKRERKRAFRKKSRLPIEEAHWQQDKQKRAIVFNCREVIDFVSTSDVDVDGISIPTKQLQLPLIELALQVVGLKMNGRLEDARDIARRIVGSTASTPTTPFDSTQIQQLSNYNMGTNIPVDKLDDLLLKCLELIDQCQSEYLPNWQLSNGEGQTMLHLSASLGLTKFSRKLLSKRPALDVQDKSGFTPLHFAALYDHIELVELFLEHGAKPDQRTYTKHTYKELLSVMSASSFEFNNDIESSSDEQSDAAEPEETFEPESALDYFNPAKSLASFFASWRESSMFRAEGSTNNNEEQYFWNFIYKNLYGNNEVEQKPPSYEEIFPAGSSSGGDFSGSVIEDVKTVSEIEAQSVIETEVDTTMELKTTEADLLEAWKNKRKKIQNDGMFLFFWLPVFIFMLVWVSMKLVHIVDDFGFEEKVGYVKDFVKARVVG
ncbi:hypothetical protein D0Z03_000282 [Geotrichum reessii]|nr:hypothetical protein D0Z03_000282 [Galactomyces reessii]